MKLAQFAALIGASPKWVLNSLPVIGGEVGYTLKNARRLAVTRSLNGALGIPLPLAWRFAARALDQWDGIHPARLFAAPDDVIRLEIDMPRLMSAFNVRRSRVATMHHARRPGRPRRRTRDPVSTASEYGLDVSLLRANLHRTREQRLRQLDRMVEFRRRVQRVTSN